jgi:hypothetical protein
MMPGLVRAIERPRGSRPRPSRRSMRPSMPNVGIGLPVVASSA